MLLAANVDHTRFHSEMMTGIETGSEGDLLDEARAPGVVLHLEPALVRDPHPVKDAVALARLTAFMRRGRYDLVHTHTAKAGVIGRIAARAAGVPHVVTTVHGWGFHPEMSPRAFLVYTSLERFAARFCDVFVEEGYFTGDQARKVLSEAERLGLSGKVHADEFSDTGGAELAAEVRAVSADHLVHASSDGIRKMAESGTIAVLLPASSLASRIPFAKARHFVEMGVPVALGTDLNPNCWTESMALVVALAVHQLGLTPAEALTAATVNAAHAVGMGRELGSLEVGKRADLLVLDAPDHRHLAYRIGGRVVETVVKDGRVAWRRPRAR